MNQTIFNQNHWCCHHVVPDQDYQRRSWRLYPHRRWTTEWDLVGLSWFSEEFVEFRWFCQFCKENHVDEDFRWQRSPKQTSPCSANLLVSMVCSILGFVQLDETFEALPFFRPQVLHWMGRKLRRLPFFRFLRAHGSSTKIFKHPEGLKIQWSDLQSLHLQLISLSGDVIFLRGHQDNVLDAGWPKVGEGAQFFFVSAMGDCPV